MTSINDMFKLTQRQGHKVKSQGEIFNNVKKLFWPLIIIA